MSTVTVFDSRPMLSPLPAPVLPSGVHLMLQIQTLPFINTLASSSLLKDRGNYNQELPFTASFSFFFFLSIFFFFFFEKSARQIVQNWGK